MKSKALAKAKRNRAVKLLADGYSYDQIAAEVGFSHRGSAHRAVAKALEEQQAEDVEMYRHLECKRLDELFRVHYPAAIAGDTVAANLVLRIMKMRISLLCLDKRSGQSRDEGPQAMILGS